MDFVYLIGIHSIFTLGICVAKSKYCNRMRKLGLKWQQEYFSFRSYSSSIRSQNRARTYLTHLPLEIIFWPDHYNSKDIPKIVREVQHYGTSVNLQVILKHPSNSFTSLLTVNSNQASFLHLKFKVKVVDDVKFQGSAHPKCLNRIKTRQEMKKRHKS